MIKNANSLPKLVSRVNITERTKSTILKKWADYWKNLFIDYRQAFQDLRTDIQDDPKRALRWTFGLTSLYLLGKNNPDEMDFKDTLKTTENEVILVSESCLNQKAADHLRFLQRCYNEGVIHYRSFGIASVMYVTEFNDNCSVYKAKCSYLQPSYFSFPSRIVDVGIMGRWWNIFIKSSDYDVN